MTRMQQGVAAVLTPLALLVLAACTRESHDDMRWARAALGRNPSLEIVAVDTQSRTFTVRVKGSGELRIVRADDVMAFPAGADAAASAAHTPNTANTSNTPISAPTPAAAPAPGATAAAPPPEVVSAMPPLAPAPLAPGAAARAHTPPAPVPATLTPQGPAAATVAERVLEAGPGYSIRAAGAAPTAGAATAGITSSAVQHRHEPIVCQGSRLLHIDNLNLVFDGDAVSAEDGCEIHITNSHISATGVGVSARAANVHIDNCLIEGKQASIDASEGAQVYAADTRFRGLSRRLDSAAFHDLGGNIWN